MGRLARSRVNTETGSSCGVEEGEVSMVDWGIIE